jgi:hypothetical protein
VRHEPLVAVPVADRDVRLDGCLLHLVDAVGLLEHEVGLGKAASMSPTSASMWWTMLRDASCAPSMSGSSWMTGAPFFDRLVLVEDGGQDLVGDVDQLERLLGDLLRVRGHGGDAVADVADLVVEADLVVGGGLG